jgi:hypothetical protein
LVNLCNRQRDMRKPKVSHDRHLILQMGTFNNSCDVFTASGNKDCYISLNAIFLPKPSLVKDS